MRRTLLLIFVLSASGVANAATQKAIVIVPVADLRSDQSLPALGKSDDKQQTQLLFGETVEVVKTSGDWVYVNAIEQPEYSTRKRWEGYPGWVRRDLLNFVAWDLPVTYILRKPAVTGWTGVWDKARDPNGDGLFPLELPVGSFLRTHFEENGWAQLTELEGSKWISVAELRPIESKIDHIRWEILDIAKIYLGTPYAWGGLSPAADNLAGKPLLLGLDCSGLVHLAYRVNGITIPRDSMEQYMRAQKIDREKLRPADLVFLAPADKPKKISHVMLYAGDELLVEAPQTGMAVRKISFQEKFGVPLRSVKSGQKIGDRVVYFGRYLKD